MGHLEKGVDLLRERWMNVSPALKQQFYDSVQPLSTQVRALQSEIKKVRYSLGGAIGWTSVGLLSAEASS